MTFPKIGLNRLTTLGAFQGWQLTLAELKPTSPELPQIGEEAKTEFNRVGYDQVILRIQTIINKLFLKNAKGGEAALPFFLAVYYWMCHKIDLIDVNQPESSKLLILRDQLLDAFVNMRYPDMEPLPEEDFLRLLREVHETLVSIGEAKINDLSWEELGSLLYHHRFLLDAALKNIRVKEQSTYKIIDCDLIEQMLIAQKIKTQISLDLDDLMRRIHESNFFAHPSIRECIVDFREDAKKAVEITQQEIAAFDWEQMDHSSTRSFFTVNLENINERFYFFKNYEKNLISGLKEALENQEEEVILKRSPDSSIGMKVPQVHLRNRNEIQAMLDHALAKQRLHWYYDAKIVAPQDHLVDILFGIRIAKERNPKKWALEWPKAIQEWQKRMDVSSSLSIQEIDRMWESEKPVAKKRAGKAKGSKVKASERVAKRVVVIKESPKTSLPEYSLARIIQEVVPSGLLTDYTMNALRQARIYEIDLLVVKQMLGNGLPKEQVSPLSFLAIRVSALYLEQLFRSEVLDWKNDPEASLQIHNLRSFNSQVAKRAEGLVNRLFLAHYWVDYPEEQWKKWQFTNHKPPELLSQMQRSGSFNQESIQALTEEVLKLGRNWIEDKTKGNPVQKIPEQNTSSLAIPAISLTPIKKRIRKWPQPNKEIMERLLSMVDFCFKAPMPLSFQIRHGLHWMHLSLESALRHAVQRKTGVMPRSHDLLSLADKAQISLSDEERQYLIAYFQRGRQLSSYLYDWAQPEMLLDRLLLDLDQGQEIPSTDVIQVLVNGYSPLLAKLLV